MPGAFVRMPVRKGRNMKIGGIEAGGTKMVCTVADENGTLLDRTVISTGTPDETIPDMIAYFKKSQIEALGIGCFGPLDLNPASPSYGCITRTPKAGWSGYNIAGAFSDALSVPIGLDTDVNAAILGEVVWGAAKGCTSAIYITVGTGIGVGVYVNGALLHGLVHPEAGHILLSRHPEDNFSGVCPFHGCCLEGMASGPAIEKRWGQKGTELGGRAEVWELEAYYLAQAIADYILAYSPEKIILWGGVMHQAELFPLVRKKAVQLLAGYVHHPLIEEHMDEYIVPPALGENPGILGAVYLGILAKEKENAAAGSGQNSNRKL
jgi:fructokinase